LCASYPILYWMVWVKDERMNIKQSGSGGKTTSPHLKHAIENNQMLIKRVYAGASYSLLAGSWSHCEQYWTDGKEMPSKLLHDAFSMIFCEVIR
jgi:hypothetical protein